MKMLLLQSVLGQIIVLTRSGVIMFVGIIFTNQLSGCLHETIILDAIFCGIEFPSKSLILNNFLQVSCFHDVFGREMIDDRHQINTNFSK